MGTAIRSTFARAPMKVAPLALMMVWAVCHENDASPPCQLQSNIRSGGGGASASVTFISFINEPLSMYWVNDRGDENNVGILAPEGDVHQNTYIKHSFRIRRPSEDGSGEVVGEYTVSKRKQTFQLHPCGTLLPPNQRFDARSKEFEALAVGHAVNCNDQDTPSSQWSCSRCVAPADFHARKATEYGFTKEEGRQSRRAEGEQTDTGYVEQIPFIRKLTNGPGYFRMNMTASMRKTLLDWYHKKKSEGRLKFDEVIPGGYSNSQRINFGQINLDEHQEMRMQIITEMHDVLQWWTNQSLRHTSTFGVRVYPREGMLINHVDREDTHLASAVLQVAQEVDPDGGWPLEVLQPNGVPCEVYLQPGEMVLYEGAWLKHGRPMRFKGDEFANVFTHFKPRDWEGTWANRKNARIQNQNEQALDIDDDL